VLSILPCNLESDCTKIVPWSPEWKYYFLPSAGGIVQHPLRSKRERKASIHMAKIRQARGKDLKEYVMRFNREVVLILDLQDGVAYAAFLGGLLSGRFTFSLVESKVITLVDALKRAQGFIQAIEICDGDDSMWQDTSKRVGVNNDSQSNKRPRKDKEVDG